MAWDGIWIMIIYKGDGMGPIFSNDINDLHEISLIIIIFIVLTLFLFNVLFLLFFSFFRKIEPNQVS